MNHNNILVRMRKMQAVPDFSWHAILSFLPLHEMELRWQWFPRALARENTRLRPGCTVLPPALLEISSWTAHPPHWSCHRCGHIVSWLIPFLQKWHMYTQTYLRDSVRRTSSCLAAHVTGIPDYLPDSIVRTLLCQNQARDRQVSHLVVHQLQQRYNNI